MRNRKPELETTNQKPVFHRRVFSQTYPSFVADIVFHIFGVPNMNGKPEGFVPFNPRQKPSYFVCSGIKPCSLQICFGFWIPVVKARQERFSVMINDDAQINRGITQTSTTKINDPADPFLLSIEKDMVRRYIGIDHS